MSPELDELRAEVEEFVEEMLPDSYDLAAAPDRPKAIHDNVWGTLVLDPWEIDLIDSPLVQRLRGIKQTGITHLTFPSTSQTRFEHALGCLAVATRMFDEMAERASEDIRQFVTRLDRQELRFAALLHDVGHGVFSHASEAVAGADPRVRRAIVQAGLETSAPFEFFSHLIIASTAFSRFLARLQDKYGTSHPVIAQIDQSRLANLVVGRADRERYYLATLISGPFDADKLDYIARDSRASGLEFLVDIPRLHYAMQLDWVRTEGDESRVIDRGADDDAARLTLLVAFSAATVLEQMLFAKIQLYTIVYHHPKVRAAEGLGRAALRILQRNGDLRSPLDLLRLSDEAFTYSATPMLGRRIESFGEQVDLALNLLSARRLPKRAAVLTTGTYVDPEGVLQDPASTPLGAEIEQTLAELIRAQAGESVAPSEIDVLVDLPSSPKLDEATLAVVRGPDDQVYTLAQTFPVQGWLRSYAERKWRGHIFGPHDSSKLPAIWEAARDVLSAELDVELDVRSAKLAHVNVA